VTNSAGQMVPFLQQSVARRMKKGVCVCVCVCVGGAIDQKKPGTIAVSGLGWILTSVFLTFVVEPIP
jgi:hypothetical protein